MQWLQLAAGGPTISAPTCNTFKGLVYQLNPCVTRTSNEYLHQLGSLLPSYRTTESLTFIYFALRFMKIYTGVMYSITLSLTSRQIFFWPVLPQGNKPYTHSDMPGPLCGMLDGTTLSAQVASNNVDPKGERHNKTPSMARGSGTRMAFCHGYRPCDRVGSQPRLSGRG